MEKVFISYSSKDFAWAESICRMLEKHEVQCFLDQRDLDRSLPSWSTQLMQNLFGSTHIVLLLSRSSIVSQQVINEIGNASATGMDIIPLLRENIAIPEALMLHIRQYEWIHLYDYSEEDGEAVLCKRILGSRYAAQQKDPVKIEPNEFAQFEAVCFSGINNGGYGAGWDKCLIQNGVGGWKPGDIVLEDIINTEFTFASIGMPELDDAYKAYCQTAEVQRMRARGNDRTRWMVAEIYQNQKIFLTLQKTCFSMTSFWWNRVRSSAELQKQMAKHVFNQEETFFPNSFCLHLILETQDHKLVGTVISNNKKNDYNRTLAITVGEQISETDIASVAVNNGLFIYQWVKRTMLEEFNFQNEDFEKYVDVSSICVLALSYEGNIYNFALPVFVQLRMDFEGLLTYLNTINKSIDEFTDIVALTAEDALEITRSWKEEELRSRYHPSSYLRALLYAVYRGAVK